MVAVLALAATLVQSPAKVEDLAWMSGNWSCEIWGGTFEECWTKPGGGTMQATGRHIADGKTGMMEFLSIEPLEGQLRMFIVVGALSERPGAPARFDLVKLEGKSATFSREKEDDFPKTITYTYKGADAMECVLTGTEGGRAQKAVFNFTRAK
jgi:hypothetical protein